MSTILEALRKFETESGQSVLGGSLLRDSRSYDKRLAELELQRHRPAGFRSAALAAAGAIAGFALCSAIFLAYLPWLRFGGLAPQPPAAASLAVSPPAAPAQAEAPAPAPPELEDPDLAVAELPPEAVILPAKREVSSEPLPPALVRALDLLLSAEDGFEAEEAMEMPSTASAALTKPAVDRTPPPPPPPAAQAPSRAERSVAFNLEGVVWDAQKPLARINGRNVRKGDVIDGAQIASIEPHEVRLRIGGRELPLRIGETINGK